MEASKADNQGAQDRANLHQRDIFSKTMFWFSKLINNYKVEILMCFFAIASYIPNVFVQHLVIEKLYNEKNFSELFPNMTSNVHIGEDIPSVAAQYLMLYAILSQIPALVLSLFLGNWSDIYGRKYAILIPLLGRILTCVLLLLYYYCPNWRAKYIIFAGIPTGLSCGYSGFMLGIFAYIRDIHPDETVSIRISIVNGIESLSYQLGPVIGLQLFDHFNYPAVFGCSIILYVIAATFAYVMVNDKIQQKANWKIMLKDFFRYRAIAECFKTAFKKRNLNRRAYLATIFVSVILVCIAMNGSEEIIYLYTRLNLRWDISNFTYYQLLSTGCKTIGMLFLLPFLIHYFKLTDVMFGMIGCAGLIASCLGNVAFASDTIAMYCVGSFSLISSMLIVVPRSCISKLVSATEIGKIMSFYAILQALGQNMEEIISTQIYVATLGSFIRSYFIIAAIISVIVLCLYGYIFFDNKRRENEAHSKSNDEE